ncbi:hypothetical protein [Halpernia frigidisoli]|uniref:Chitinase n=1 Tax=Halpernia frigidisoli TaxID=1125876 RepID=A0A1I3IQ17_9FLAO|nr:hypothetical protein [Halpernia frigidisoli]SFI50061.1 hypothetical protein SAMN05443292_2731 [Halpernia frigidisoli]
MGETYKLQAYLYNAEGGGLIITPKPAKIPKINKVELFYVDDTKGVIFSYMERLRAKANCVNMFGKELIFTLWEDDAKGAEHDEKNLPIASQKARVNKNGLATVDFSLTMALMLKASRGEQDGQLEFYVTVEFYKNNKHATNNVNVKGIPISSPKEQSKPKVPPKAKGSPSESKLASKKEESGIMATISKKWDELWDWAEGKGTATKEKPPTVEKSSGKSTTEVKEVKKEDKKDDKCPNCKKEITIDEVNKVLGDKEDQEYRKNIILLLNQFINKRKGTKGELHINTCLRKAHFLSEIATETSLLEKKLTEGNTPPYYSENNIKNLWPGKYKDLVNSGKLSTVASERPQKQLLNFVYGKKNGNKGGDDGWNYRGKGLIQLTGRTNYNDASVFLKKVFPEEYVDLEANYDKVAELKYAVLSSIAFWEGKSIYNIADISKTKETVPNVRFFINSYDKNNSHTKKYFENAIEAFKVTECKKDKVESKKSNSKVQLDFVGKTAKESALSEKTKNILREVGEASGTYYIAITSTARTPYDQARIMYDNCKANLKEQRTTYKAPGQRVIDVYVNNSSKSRDAVIKLMEQKINELGPSTVSKHLANPEIVNTFDISYGNLKDKTKFLSEMTKRPELDVILIENNCYHTQINQK